MSLGVENNEVVENIVKVVKSFKKEDQKTILKRLQIEAYLKNSKSPIAKYDNTLVKAPTMHEIDNWKHKARNAK